MAHADVYCDQCFCGAIQFTLSRESAEKSYCHCDACRRRSASVVNAFALWKPEAPRVTHDANDISVYNRTPHRYRKSRRLCGGHRFTEPPGLDLIDVYAAVVDDFPYEPGVHVRYPESVLPLQDGLRKHRDQAGEMGGSDISAIE